MRQTSDILKPHHWCLRSDCHSAEYVKEAVQEDNDGNYKEAFELYKKALEYFSAHLKYEKNPRAKETITMKVPAPWLALLLFPYTHIAQARHDLPLRSSRSILSGQSISRASSMVRSRWCSRPPMVLAPDRRPAPRAVAVAKTM